MSEAPSPRDRLLAATIAYVARHGLADLSLRTLAEAIGTSHRMLIYHFGSKEGLLAKVGATSAAPRSGAASSSAPCSGTAGSTGSRRPRMDERAARGDAKGRA